MEQVAADARQWPCVSVAILCSRFRGGTDVPNRARYVRKELVAADSMISSLAAEAVPNAGRLSTATKSVVLLVVGERYSDQLLVAAEPDLQCSVERDRSWQIVARRSDRPERSCFLEETRKTSSGGGTEAMVLVLERLEQLHMAVVEG